MRSGGLSQKLTAILQHATAEKRDGDGMLLFFFFFFFFNFKSSYPSFGLKFRYMYILIAQVLPGMQDKLSKSRDLALEPMG